MSDPTTAKKYPAAQHTTLAPPGSLICPRCGAVVAAGARFCPACGAALAQAHEAAEDHLLTRLRNATQGEYDVLREIGRGGMAAVYLAWDRELARYVAIKVLLPELAHHPTMSQRFLQEARTAANLDEHPSVVRVYRAKEAQGLRYFVMKYVDGCTLEQLLRSTGPLPAELAAHVIDQVALALQYAHERGVVHRDVKPGNILLDRSGGVVVTDFGIAKVAEGEQLTRTGVAIGTPHYMSPEQWRIEPLTPASDQYALGVVAYYLVTGDVPFDGTQYAIQEGHLRTEPPLLSAKRDGVPPALDAVVRRMLAKAPGDRYADLRSVSGALAAIPRDPAPALREQLSRLIPAANAPGVREVPSPDVPASPPHVGVERRSATPPALAAIAVASATSRSPTAVLPSVPVPSVPVPSVPVPDVVLEPVAAGATDVPELAAELAPAFSPEPAPAPLAVDVQSAPVLDATSAFRPLPSIGPEDEGDDYVRPMSILEGPISRTYPQRRVGPWLAAAVVTAMLGGGRRALRSRPSRAPEAADAVAPTAAAVPGPAPASAARTAPAVGTAGGAAMQDTVGAGGVTAGTSPEASAAPSADTLASTPIDSAASAVPNAPTGMPGGMPGGVPAALLIVGGSTRGIVTVPVGDSVRLRARVNDARGARLFDATVEWASSDPARVAYRNGYAVALAPGGPVAVTAVSGALSRSVRVVVGPRVGLVSTSRNAGGVARPTEAELRTEVQRFVAALNAHDAGDVSRRLAPRAVDGSPSREFVQWLEGAEDLTADPPALGKASDEGARARVAFRVPLRWRAGLLGERRRKDVTFWMTLTHDEQGWHGGEVLLGERVAP